MKCEWELQEGWKMRWSSSRHTSTQEGKEDIVHAVVIGAKMYTRVFVVLWTAVFSRETAKCFIVLPTYFYYVVHV